MRYTVEHVEGFYLIQVRANKRKSGCFWINYVGNTKIGLTRIKKYSYPFSKQDSLYWLGHIRTWKPEIIIIEEK